MIGRGGTPPHDLQGSAPSTAACLGGDADEATARRVAAHVEDCRRCGLETAVCQEIKDSLARQVVPHESTMARLRDFGSALPGATQTYDETAGLGGGRWPRDSRW
ncbi:hypothetical protein [Streptomyces sp. NPDC056628]|uniref:hypothetical protein n=1 Tax=Streptomyces sp. NPDC056628 TaxID=3345882 RepID=UPI0036A0F2AC